MQAQMHLAAKMQEPPPPKLATATATTVSLHTTFSLHINIESSMPRYATQISINLITVHSGSPYLGPTLQPTNAKQCRSTLPTALEHP